MNPFETYAFANRHLNDGELDAAITLYSRVIQQIPQFPLAYFNRAVARVRMMADNPELLSSTTSAAEPWREEILDDLWATLVLGYDDRFAEAISEEDFFLGAASNIVTVAGYSTLFDWSENVSLDESVCSRLAAALLVLLERESYLLQESHASDIYFNVDRLPARVVLGDILRLRKSGQPLIRKMLVAIDSNESLVDDDPELAWRIPFLLGWMLYCTYQRNETRDELVFDDWFIENMFTLSRAIIHI